jgi:AraC-like DNA-binding protein
VLLGLAVPFAFWALARVHFEDEFCLCGRHWPLLLGLLATGYLSFLIAVGHPAAAAVPAQQRPFWLALPKLIGVVLVIHALLQVYAGAQSDLLVSRLRLRYGVLTFSGSFVLLELLAEVLLQGAAKPTADLVHAAGVYLLVLGISIAALLVHADLLKPARIPAAQGPALDPELAGRLQQLLDAEQVYRREGLTIAALAERLGAQEYKVRQLINAQLGFKNFNAFLNHYRVRDAALALADPSRQHLGVAEIAYSMGYGSLGPFNKAFKELNSSTPTEYRAARMGRGGPSQAPSLADSESRQPSPGIGQTEGPKTPILTR